MLPAGDKLLGVSDNRGTANEEVDITSTGLTGDLLIQVSSYDGHPTTDPVRDPRRGGPAAGAAAVHADAAERQRAERGALPTNASIPATAQTLILFNEKRLGQYYNTRRTTRTPSTRICRRTQRGATSTASSSRSRRTRVSPAYANWDHVNGTDDESLLACRGERRRARDRHAARLAAGGTSEPEVDGVVGADNVIPFARMLDHDAAGERARLPRRTFGSSTTSTSAPSPRGYLLSDDPYADPDPQSVVGGSLYVPKLALGRLVETPADICRAARRRTSRQRARESADEARDRLRLPHGRLAGRRRCARAHAEPRESDQRRRGRPTTCGTRSSRSAPRR